MSAIKIELLGDTHSQEWNTQLSSKYTSCLMHPSLSECRRLVCSFASLVPSVLKTVVLSLVEIPGWCISNGRCYWSCYPDFSRNYHMSKWMSMLFEGPLLLVLAAMALVDVVSETMPCMYRACRQCRPTERSRWYE